MNYFIVGGDGERYGPKPEAEIRAWIREGRLNAESHMAAEGSQDWQPLKQFPEFAAELNPGAAAPTAAATQPAAARPVQSYPQYAVVPKNRTHPMAIAGMICGIISLPMTCCCYGFPFNILGLVFSIIGLVQTKKNPHEEGRGMAIAGLICAGLSLLSIIVLLIFGIAVNVYQP